MAKWFQASWDYAMFAWRAGRSCLFQGDTFHGDFRG
jgi:hypothetical protein